MKLIAIIEKVDNGRYEITGESHIANCFLYGLGSTIDEAKVDFMQSVHDMQEFTASTKHPKWQVASKLTVEYRNYAS